MNSTEKAIKLRSKTPIGILAPVTVHSFTIKERAFERQLKSVCEKRQEVEAKGLSLNDSASIGEDLNNLIELLHTNIDLLATSLMDLPGCKLLNIDSKTVDNPPVK